MEKNGAEKRKFQTLSASGKHRNNSFFFFPKFFYKIFGGQDEKTVKFFARPFGTRYGGRKCFPSQSSEKTIPETGTFWKKIATVIKKTGSPRLRRPRKKLLFYLFMPSCTATATATVAPTIGLLPMPMSPIISTCAGTEEEPANCASECILPIVSVMP